MLDSDSAFADSARVQSALRRVFALTLVAVLVLFCLPPVYYVLKAALADDATGITQMLDDPAFPATLRITVILAVGSVSASLILGTVLAWGAQGLTGRSQWFANLPLVPLLMPFLAIVMGFIYLFDDRIGYGNLLLRKLPFWSNADRGPFDVYTVPFIVIVTATSLTSFVYMFVRSALAQLDASAYDAAVASGARPARAFFAVILPMLRPALVYSALMGVLLALGQFTAPLFLGTQDDIDVLASSIYDSLQQPPPNVALAAAYGLPITIAGLLFIALQRLVLSDQDRFVSSGTKGTGRSVHKTGWLSRLALIGYGLLVVVGPIGSVAIVAFQPYWSKDVSFETFTLDNFEIVLNAPIIAAAVKNSVVYAILSTLIVLPLGFFCSKLLYRRQQRVLSGAVDVLVSIPLGVPSVIFGIGFLLAYTQGPLNLYGQSLGLVLVYVVIALPFVVRSMLVGLVSLGHSLMDAGAVSGASLWRRVVFLELPMLRPAIGNAAAISLVLATHEFSASVLVASTNTQVMGVALKDQYELGSGSIVAALALLMCLITGACVLVAQLLSRPIAAEAKAPWRERMTSRLGARNAPPATVET